MRELKNLIYGIVIGIANIIPGVSGGTMAVVLNVYDRFIESVSGFRKHVKQSLIFLIPLVIGMLAGILLFSKVLEWLLANYPIATNFFFLGVIIGSIPMIFKRAIKTDFKWRNLIPLVITLAVMIFIAVYQPAGQGQVDLSLSLGKGILLFICGALAAAAMIIPGVSGSFIMLLIGMYATILEAVSTLNWLILLIFGVGAVVGIIGISKIMGKLMERHPQATYFAILGLILGSLPGVYPGFAWNIEGLIAVIVLLIGIGASFYFSLEHRPRVGVKEPGAENRVESIVKKDEGMPLEKEDD